MAAFQRMRRIEGFIFAVSILADFREVANLAKFKPEQKILDIHVQYDTRRELNIRLSCCSIL